MLIELMKEQISTNKISLNARVKVFSYLGRFTSDYWDMQGTSQVLELGCLQ